MSDANILNEILRDNPLIGPNFVNWRRDLDYALFAQDCKFVINGERPRVPDENSSQEEKANFAKWTKANDVAKCFIIESLSKELQSKYEEYEYATDILESLCDVFADQYRPAIEEATNKLMNMKMVDGTPVQDHVRYMMSLLQELDVLGLTMDPGMKLQSQMAERIMKEHMSAGTLHIGESSSGPSENKDQEKNLASNVQQPQYPQYPAANALGVRRRKSNSSKSKCFHCQEHGHWKRNCKNFLAKKKSANTGVPDNKAPK